MKKDIYDSIIIGGGFYGLYIADFIASQGKRVLLCEYEDSCMTHASYNNQARIHSGYHYPRSLLTGMPHAFPFHGSSRNSQIASLMILQNITPLAGF